MGEGLESCEVEGTGIGSDQPLLSTKIFKYFRSSVETLDSEEAVALRGLLRLFLASSDTVGKVPVDVEEKSSTSPVSWAEPEHLRFLER